jgi:hypothetical protein
MDLNKQQAIERLVNWSIRATFGLEDPVPVHVILMASYDALREYAKAKNIFIEFEWNDYIKEEFQKEWVNKYFKNKFYFLKHGTPDIETTSFENLTSINDIQLLHNIMMYQTIFGQTSAHMKQFSLVVMGIYPRLVRWEKFDLPTDFRDRLHQIAGTLDRHEMLAAFRHEFLSHDVNEEIKRDQALALTEAKSRRSPEQPDGEVG